MLIFITSIRHPLNCRSFDNVNNLLQYTLKSVYAQNIQSFQVIVVCNKESRLTRHQQAHYIEVDFPAPSTLHRPDTGMAAIQLDRGTKYAAGLLFARELNPTYIMFFDADDLVSRNMTKYVESSPICAGWYFERGYRFRMGDSCVTPVNSFYKHCGTSHIFNFHNFSLPTDITHNSGQQEILTAFGESYVKSILGSHRLANKLHAMNGNVLVPFPFFGAVWVLGHGENHSGKTGKAGTLCIDNNMQAEFSFPQAYMSLEN